MSLFTDELKDLEQRCKEHEPPYDLDRLIALANALHRMIIKRKRNRHGQWRYYATVYKYKKSHHRHPADYRENF